MSQLMKIVLAIQLFVMMIQAAIAFDIATVIISGAYWIAAILSN